MSESIFDPLLLKLKDAFKQSGTNTLTDTHRFAISFFSEKLDWRHFRDVVFNRKEANAKYVELFNKVKVEERKPIFLIQKSIHQTHALHRSFVARYKTRLQHYRDDLGHKMARLPHSINVTNGKSKALAQIIQGER